MKLTVNQREMNFIQNGTILSLPILSSTNKLGKNLYWRIYIENQLIYREKWQEGGKIQTFDPIGVEQKNVGRANETSIDEQLAFEAYSLWLKKQDQGYSLKGSTVVDLRPMLAQKYNADKHTDFPYAVSAKIDGVRAIAYLDENGEVVMKSRAGKTFEFLYRIKEQLKQLLKDDIILDGELYSHDIPFEAISGSVRSKKKPSEYDDQLEYWIFDMAVPDLGYEDRMRKLPIIHSLPNIKYILYNIVQNMNDIIQYHSTFVGQGYEGIIIRVLNGVYDFGYRSKFLLKHKNFEDDEFEITGMKTGKGTEEDAIVFMCITPNGETFDARPRGTIKRRREMWKKGGFVGKKLTVRFQEYSQDGIPRFPVGVEVRDYE